MVFDRHGRYRFLSEDEIEKIHMNSLKLLNDVGVRFPNKKVLRLLGKAGCKIDHDTGVVRIPPDVMEFNLEVSRKERNKTGYKAQDDTNGKDEWHIKGIVSGSIVNALDKKSGVVRSATLQDLHESICIANGLDCVFTCNPLFLPQDVPSEIADLYQMSSILKYAKKPGTVYKLSPSSFENSLKLGIIALGSEEEVKKKGLLDYKCFISSPLYFPEDALKMALIAVEMGGKLRCGTPMTVMGATSPVTIAGAVTQSNAEMLAGILLGNCLGCIQTFYNISNISVDQRNSTGCYADPRKLLACGASLDMGRYYGLESSWHWGADAFVPGIQASVELMFGTMLGLFLDDSDPFMRVGVLGPSGLSASVIQMIIDAEVCSMINAFLKGIVVDDEHIAFDVIKRVGIGGNYITDDHSFKFFRDEMWVPELFERRQPAVGSEIPVEKVCEKALQKVEDVVNAGQEPNVTREQMEEMDRLLLELVKLNIA